MEFDLKQNCVQDPHSISCKHPLVMDAIPNGNLYACSRVSVSNAVPLCTLKDSLYKSKLHEGLMDYPLSSSSLFISTESCSSGFEPDLSLSRTCWYILRSSSSLMISAYQHWLLPPESPWIELDGEDSVTQQPEQRCWCKTYQHQQALQPQGRSPWLPRSHRMPEMKYHQSSQ